MSVLVRSYMVYWLSFAILIEFLYVCVNILFGIVLRLVSGYISFSGWLFWCTYKVRKLVISLKKLVLQDAWQPWMQSIICKKLVPKKERVIDSMAALPRKNWYLLKFRICSNKLLSSWIYRWEETILQRFTSHRAIPGT